MMKLFDLQAHRCPTAFILLRRAVKDFNCDANPGDVLAVQTIEPSIARDLPVFLNSESFNIGITKELKGEIGEESIIKWQDRFDSEDWAGQTQYCFLLTKS
jgi:TusA-related sulfurtransferase